MVNTSCPGIFRHLQFMTRKQGMQRQGMQRLDVAGLSLADIAEDMRIVTLVHCESTPRYPALPELRVDSLQFLHRCHKLGRHHFARPTPGRPEIDQQRQVAL